MGPALSPHPEAREAMTKNTIEAKCSKLTITAGSLHLCSWGLQASGLQTPTPPPRQPLPSFQPHRHVPSTRGTVGHRAEGRAAHSP